MSELRLLYDPLSQPSRAVVMFLDANKIPYEPVLAKIAEGKWHQCTKGNCRGLRILYIRKYTLRPKDVSFHGV